MAAEDVEGRASVHIDAPPEKVYDMITDVTRMGDWSPECVKAEWVGDATGPAVGARFKGHNKLNWLIRWSTTPTVKVADPGKEFTFETGRPGNERRAGPTGSRPRTVARSSPSPSSRCGTGAFMKMTARPARRTAKLTADIQQTLERIKQAAEGSA